MSLIGLLYPELQRLGHKIYGKTIILDRSNSFRDTRKTARQCRKSEKSHFFLRQKKSCKIVRFKSLKNLFFDSRPENGPKNCFPDPRFFRYVGFQWLLRKRVLKIGHYLETRFSEKKIQHFCLVEISVKKKYFWSKLFFCIVYNTNYKNDKIGGFFCFQLFICPVRSKKNPR